MAVTTIQTTGASRRWTLPNILTYGRVVAVPVVVVLLFWPDLAWMRWTALCIFILAGVTDFFDGYLARAWSQQSSLGRMLDPIADKLLVAAVLLMLVADHTITGFSIWAAIVILCREILVSGLREYLAELKVSVPVSRVAKWKTTLQLVALGFLIAGRAADLIVPGVTEAGLILLWVAAILTLYTGWDYMKAGLKHVVDG
jgi:cardiolipin synthase